MHLVILNNPIYRKAGRRPVYGMDNVISFGGIFAILACAWALSESRQTVNWKLMGWGLGLQMILAVGIFVTDQGRAFFLPHMGNGPPCAGAKDRSVHASRDL
jgi:hypothetical protein